MALTPQTVPVAQVRQANAVLRLSTSSAMITGAAAGGVLVAVVGPGWGIAVDAASFTVAAVCFARIQVGPGESAAGRGPREHPLRSLRDGWTEFVSRTWVWVVVAQFMVLNAATSGGFAVLGPVVADDTIGRRAWGLVLAAHTIGMVVGGMLALHWQPRRALAFGVALMACESLPLLLLGLDPAGSLLALATFLSGIAVEQFVIAWDVSLQQNVPADRLSRVYSYDALGSLIAMPLGQVAVGPLAAGFGVRSTLVGCALLALVPTGLALLSPSLRALRRNA